MTLIEHIHHGDVPDILEKVAVREGIGLEELIAELSDGTCVITANALRIPELPCAIGRAVRVKVNANIGTSGEYPALGEELEKLAIAISAGADTVMDLSTGGDIGEIRRAVLSASPVPVGTVPIYEAALTARETHGDIVKMDAVAMLDAIRRQAADGVDFMTIHAGLTSKSIDTLTRAPRRLGVVSRGGAFLLAWMLVNEQENPLYERFDDVIEICREYDVTISLGDSLRPGCLDDSTDAAQLEELIVLGTLVERAREASVQVMVEGPGHIPLDQIEMNVRLQKHWCADAPFYVLGPLVTDSAPGYDHVVSAIGGAVAGWHGADFLCYVTPREHLGLPTVSDVRDGVVMSRIAAHAADIARGRKDALAHDMRMATARANLDWEGQVVESLDPEMTASMLKERSHGTGPCTMCGEFCAIDIVTRHIGVGIPDDCI